MWYDDSEDVVQSYRMHELTTKIETLRLAVQILLVISLINGGAILLMACL